MDEFEEKRGMIKMLLDMLKGSASKEMSDGMKAPEPKGLEVEKVSLLPHEEHDGEAESTSPEAETLADKVMPKGSIAEEMKRAPEMAAEDDEEEIPAFSSLMKRKK